MQDETLILPTDPKRIEQLRAKSKEYHARLDTYAEARTPAAAWGTICKIAVLDTLLEKGRIEFDEVMQLVLKQNSAAVAKLDSAFNVIEDYCLTGGLNVSGGTGFPPAEATPAPNTGPKEVTCRKCGHGPYVPSFSFDFYPDSEDPKVGLCERCMMTQAFAPKEPATPPEGHVRSVCKPGHGHETCSFMIAGAGGLKCGKGSAFENAIRQRLVEGTMNAKGDNCSGHPDFTPTAKN